MSDMLVENFFSPPIPQKKPGKLLKLDDFLRILPLGNHFFHHWDECFELFPRILSKSKKKGWEDGERKVGRVVVDLFCLGGFKY